MDEQNQNPPTVPQENTDQTKKTSKQTAIVAIAAVLLVGAGIAFGLWYGQKSNMPPMLPPPSLPGSQNSSDQVSQNNPEPSPVNTEPTPVDTSYLDPYAGQDCKDRGSVVASRSGLVEWITPQKLSTLHIFGQPKTNTTEYVAVFNDVNYLVGHIKDGKYAGGDFIVSEVTPDGPSVGERYRIIKKDGKYYYLAKYSSALPDPISSVTFATKLIVDSDFDLADLNFPESIHSTNPDANFTYVNSLGFFQNGVQFFCKDNLVKVFTDAVLGDVYTDKLLDEKIEGIYSYPFMHGFYVKGPDASLRSYQMDIPFMDQSVPAVTWADGKKNNNEYIYQAVGGCGAGNFMDIAKVKESDLKQIGTTIFGGQLIYAYKNSDAQDLKDMYDQTFIPEQETKESYQSFLSKRPMFFWKNPYGDFIRFKNKKYLPTAECGKPVIYLYPTKTEKISVSLNPVGGFTYTEPEYKSGWNVIADPLSNITNLADGKTYPYLFWEGRGGLYQTPDRGFVVEQKDVHKFLVTKLAQLGLNEKESKDFMEFWEPKMQSSPYYFVTFMGNQVMDEIAPLSVSPKPDTIIRVLMDFKPLEKPISVQGFNIRTPERKGFTVVEWGGVLR